MQIHHTMDYFRYRKCIHAANCKCFSTTCREYPHIVIKPCQKIVKALKKLPYASIKYSRDKTFAVILLQ